MSTTDNRCAAIETLKTLRILVRELPQDERVASMSGIAQVERLLRLLGPRTEDEYDRLHRRCMNQRKELRRLNRKIRHVEAYLKMRLGGEEYRWAIEHHRNNELSRELTNAYEQIASLTRKAEAAE